MVVLHYSRSETMLSQKLLLFQHFAISFITHNRLDEIRHVQNYTEVGLMFTMSSPLYWVIYEKHKAHRWGSILSYPALLPSISYMNYTYTKTLVHTSPLSVQRSISALHPYILSPPSKHIATRINNLPLSNRHRILQLHSPPQRLLRLLNLLTFLIRPRKHKPRLGRIPTASQPCKRREKTIRTVSRSDAVQLQRRHFWGRCV